MTANYTIDATGVHYPAGFPAHGHVNIRWEGGANGIHFDPNNNQPGGAWIGKHDIPWSAFGVPEGKCVVWVQVSTENYHYGENGESPVCHTTSTPSPTLSPSASPSLTVTPTPSTTPTLSASPSSSPDSVKPTFTHGPTDIPTSPEASTYTTSSTTAEPEPEPELAATGVADVSWGLLPLAILFGVIGLMLKRSRKAL